MVLEPAHILNWFASEKTLRVCPLAAISKKASSHLRSWRISAPPHFLSGQLIQNN